VLYRLHLTQMLIIFPRLHPEAGLSPDRVRTPTPASSAATAAEPAATPTDRQIARRLNVD
jgi:hypothetical protein